MRNQHQSFRLIRPNKPLLKWRNIQCGEKLFLARSKHFTRNLVVDWEQKTGFTFLITKIGDKLCQIERLN